ncbi:hypothetical protein BDR26DRAFT_901675 [Obelidium mucronatum]|nr:hypothetical protein BDR26DRAFT_901675 [Obelidium mucronatum]
MQGLLVSVSRLCQHCKKGRKTTGNFLSSCSTPKFQKMKACAVLTSGLTFTQVEKFLLACGIKYLAESSFYCQLSEHLTNAIIGEAIRLCDIAVLDCIADAERRGINILYGSIDGFWSHVRNAAEGGCHFMYSFFLKKYNGHPILSFAITMRQRLGRGGIFAREGHQDASKIFEHRTYVETLNHVGLVASLGETYKMVVSQDGDTSLVRVAIEEVPQVHGIGLDWGHDKKNIMKKFDESQKYQEFKMFRKRLEDYMEGVVAVAKDFFRQGIC